MEPIYKPDETKRIREELHDPLLKVEWNPRSGEWEISKLTFDQESIMVPGFLVGSSRETVKLTYPVEYWSVQTTFRHWGQYVYDDMRWGRAGYRDAKEIIAAMDAKDDHIRTRNQENMDDTREKTLKKIEKGKIVYSTPGVHSYVKAS
jgi:hypothetical protein